MKQEINPSDFWNRRYSSDEYAYGTRPNDFLKQQTFRPGSKVLCLAEGEGRNAVWLAEQGCSVTALDFSEQGLAKARLLAEKAGVQIQTIRADLSDYVLEPLAWDAVVCIFGHFPPAVRRRVLASVWDTLRPDGRLIMEVYALEQLRYASGGPADPDMLYTEEILRSELAVFPHVQVVALERPVNEGSFHHGMASVLQVKALKINS